ncbi:MAG TPA: hypothetical protein VIX80_10545 [Candidatus Kapabacteria bacterium]
MKHILLLLSILIIGCTPKGGPEQMLRMKDGREIECRLLSVRANGLVVDTSKPPAYHITNAEPGLYPFESIDKYIYDPVSASKTIVLTSTSGLLLGATFGVLSDAASGVGFGVEDGPEDQSIALYTAVGAMVGGAIVGVVVNEINHYVYDPAIPEDREQIAKHAIFKGEEPNELKKIK